MEVLEVVGQTLAHGRRDAVLLPEVVADVPGGDAQGKAALGSTAQQEPRLGVDV
jgi:hypothetical protein